MHLLHVGGLEIDDIVLLANALGRGVMLSSDKLITGRTLFETSQQIEDAALAVVQQEDAEIASEVLVPQGVLIVEETQVANDAINILIRYDGKPAAVEREPSMPFTPRLQ